MTTILSAIAKATNAYLNGKKTVKAFREDEVVQHVERAGMIGGALFVAGLVLFAMWFLFGLDGIAILFQWFLFAFLSFAVIVFCMGVAVTGAAKEADALIKLVNKYAKEELGKK